MSFVRKVLEERAAAPRMIEAFARLLSKVIVSRKNRPIIP